MKRQTTIQAFRLSEDLKVRVNELGEQKHMTFSEVVRAALIMYLDSQAN